MQLRTIQKYQMPFQIDGQSAHGMNGLLRGSRGSAGMPQSHPDPGHQLRSGERLGQIIVCAAIQRGMLWAGSASVLTAGMSVL